MAVFALVDSGAQFHCSFPLPKLRDSPSIVSIVPYQLQVTLADGVVVQAAQLATLALKVVDDQGVIVPGMLALEFYVMDMFSA